MAHILRRLESILVLVLTAPALCAAATIEVTPSDNWRAVMQGLDPGDILIMHGGTYANSSLFAVQLSGTAQAPIIIRAAAGEQPHLLFNGTNQNIINIENSAHLVIDGIEFSGGSRGIRLTASSDITIRNSHVHHTAANAISANDDGSVYARLKFLHNEIDHTGGNGEGFYLGCNNDTCRMHDSLIAGNYIHHLDGPTVDQGDGIEIKTGSYANVVRDNVIHDVAYPGIMVYHTHGNGAANLIERNLIWNSGDNGIQVCADAIVRNNIVLGAAASGIASSPIQGGVPGNLMIVNNTVINANGDAIHLSNVSGPIVLANNALYTTSAAIFANGNTAQVTALANAGEGSLQGVSAGFQASGNIAIDFASASYSGSPPQDLSPRGTLLVGGANVSTLAIDDFDDLPRGTHHDIGAYRAPGSPHWPLQAGFKVLDTLFEHGFESSPLP